MSTSGSIDLNLTVREVSTFALKLIGVTGITDTPAAEDAETARLALSMMLKTWQQNGPNLFRQTFGSVTLVAGTASYVLSPRPYKVIEARYRSSSSIDIPMTEMTRQQYVDLANKAATGIPTQYYVDRQRASTTMYVWTVPSASTGSIQYTYQRVIEDADALANDIDIPQEWLETVGYSLADRLIDHYKIENKAIRLRAAMLYQNALDDDRESFVTFEPARR